MAAVIIVLVAFSLGLLAPRPAFADERLKLVATQPDVTYLLKMGRRDVVPKPMVHIVGVQVTIHTYEPLCQAPCEIALPPGDYIFGMKQGDSRILDSRRISLGGRETLTGTWVSRRPQRLLAAYSGVAMVLAGFIVAARPHRDCPSCTRTHPYVPLGIGIAAAGAGLMIFSQFLNDEAEIAVGP